MKQSLKNFVAGALVALALFVGYAGYSKYTQLALAAEQANATYQYLAAPIAQDDKGKVITRADVLATIAKRVADASNSPQGAAQPAPNTP